MNPYSIIMFCFAGVIILYALSILSEKNGYKLIARDWATNPKDKKAYARQFAKLMSFIALAPILSGIVAFLGDTDSMVLPALIVLVVGFIFFTWLGIRLFMRKVM